MDILARTYYPTADNLDKIIDFYKIIKALTN